MGSSLQTLRSIQVRSNVILGGEVQENELNLFLAVQVD